MSPPLPVRYAALAGSGIHYRIDLQGDHDTAGHLFAVDFAAEMAFSGMANVPAGEYSFMLKAAAGRQRASRHVSGDPGQYRMAWRLTRPQPQ